MSAETFATARLLVQREVLLRRDAVAQAPAHVRVGTLRPHHRLHVGEHGRRTHLDVHADTVPPASDIFNGPQSPRSTSSACARSAGYGDVNVTWSPVDGMRERELMGVQPLPREAEPGRNGGVGAVERVADARMPVRGHVHPDLVRAPGLEMDLEQGRAGERLERLVVGDGVLALGRDRELPRVGGMPPDGRIDRAGERIGMPLHDRVVDLLHLALLEGALEHGVRVLGLGDDHETRGADVEAMDDALPLRRAGRRDAEAAGGERPEHGGTLPADRGVRGHAGGLVDHDDVVVVVHDRRGRAPRPA